MSWSSWSRSILVLLAVGIALPLIPSSAAGRSEVWEARRKKKEQPLPRIRELVDWIAVEQQDGGGWAHRLWLPLRYHLHQSAKKPKVPPQSIDGDKRRSEQEAQSFIPSSFDTAMCGLALLRAGNTLSTGDRREQVKEAAEFLYRAVQSSNPVSVTIDFRPTPLTDRIGKRADTFAALLFFVTLREQEFAARAKAAAKKGEPADRSFTYDGAIDTLLSKTQQSLDADGNWPVAGNHVPILSNALGCWALEAATRAGIDVKPEVLARAERYALSKEAEQENFKAQDTWRKIGYFEKPRQTRHVLLCDNDPLGHQIYIMSARLSILYQADLTNRTLLERERAKSRGQTMSEVEYAKINALTTAAARTKAALEAGRAAMRKTWTTVYKTDIEPSPTPIFFTGEDFLSSLLVVDAMAECNDVQKWFPPVVRQLMSYQDVDGGLRIQDPISCGSGGSCICSSAGPQMVNGKIRVPEERPDTEFRLEPQFCPSQKAWCSQGRTFVTAAGVMILLADTPYRPAFMGAK
jgi:hypothetical protein